jgi:hypothetical protein
MIAWSCANMDSKIPALARAIIHNGYARLQCMHKLWGAGFREAVVRCQIQVHCADPIRRAHQIKFSVPREVAKIDGSKAAETMRSFG